MHFLLTRPSGSAVCRGTTPSFLGAVTHSLRYHGIVDAGRNRPFIEECSKRVNMEEEEDEEDRVARQRRWGHKSLRSKSDKKKVMMLERIVAVRKERDCSSASSQLIPSIPDPLSV